MVHLSKNDFILLLGAGASAPFLPTAYGMTELFINAVKDNDDPVLSHALSLVLGGMQFLRGLKGEFPEQNFNIEEVADTLDVLKCRHTNRLSPFVGAWNELLGQFDGSHKDSRKCMDELSELLRDKIKDWLKTPPIGEIRHFQALRDFVRTFDGLDVFTLNYDLCVETALTEGEIPFTCGFDNRGWSADLFNQPDIKIKIYKLHGSLDWYRDEEDRAIYSTYSPPEGRRPVADPPPLLIFGTPYKLTPTDPFLYLSYTFSEMVKARTVIVIIGYGFGDDYVNQIILQGLSRDSRKRLIVVGRNKVGAELLFRERFAQEAEIFLDAGRVEFIDGGAQNALNDRRVLLDRVKETINEATQEGPF